MLLPTAIILIQCFTGTLAHPVQFPFKLDGSDNYITPKSHLLNSISLPHKLPFHNIDIDPLDRKPTMEPDTSFNKIGSHIAISSDLEICNNLTLHEIFEKYPGANAVDASVTLTLCIGMINFFNSGIGGGGYVTYADRRNEDNHLTIDFRELSPAAINMDMFEHDYQSKIGGLAIAVPGELKGIYDFYKLRGSGTVSWAQLLQPIIDLGYQGWKIDEALGATLKIYEPIFLELKDDWSFVLDSKQEHVLQQGDLIRRPKLSKLFFELAQNGSADPFYDPQHWIVKSMIKYIKKYDGIVEPEDFANYHVDISKPISRKIRSGFEYMPNNDLTVLTSNGTSSGPALLSALAIMDRFGNVEGGDYSEETTFKLIETMKWMASARSRLGDTSTANSAEEILSDKWINQAYEKIMENIKYNKITRTKSYKTLPHWSEYKPLYTMNEPHGTAHFSIVDRDGSAVSLTTTINLLFGSLIHDPMTGVIFNNEIDDFAQLNRSNTFNLTASEFNLIEPNKRPLSSMAPTVVLNELGNVDLVIGASGGSRITTSILQSIVRTYWYNMPLLETIAYPRVHHQLLPDVVEVEDIGMIGKDTIESMKEMGYSILQQSPKSVVNAIRWAGVEWHAVSDYWRKRGISVVS